MSSGSSSCENPLAKTLKSTKGTETNRLEGEVNISFGNVLVLRYFTLIDLTICSILLLRHYYTVLQ